MSTTAFLGYGLTLSAALVSGATAALAWRRRQQPGATWLAVMLAAVAWWAATYLGELVAPSLGGKLFWARLEWFGSILVPTAWVVFALEYTGRDRFVTRRTLAALATAWLGMVLVVLSNPVHGLVRDPVGVVAVDGLVVLDQRLRPAFYLFAAYAYLLVLFGAGLLVGLATSRRVIYRGQALLLLAAALVPLGAQVTYLAVPALVVDPTPAAFTVTGVACLLAISRYDLLEATPVAALLGPETVLDSLDEGVLVVDGRGEVVDANARAGTYLSRSSSSLLGEPLADLVPELAAWEGDDRAVVTRRVGRRERTLEVNDAPLRDWHGRTVGRTLVFRDVTERHEHTQRVEVLGRVIRHNLRNEMSVVLGYVEQLREDHGDAVMPSAGEIEAAAEKLLEMGDRARKVEEYLDREESPRRVRFADLVDRVAADRAARYPDATVGVRSLPDGSVTCDALLEPVLENLVDNGLRHDPGEDPTVRIDAAVDDGVMTVRVADTGPGIPEDERAVLAAGRETPLEHGSGLGLWLANWCLDRIGGSLSFEDGQEGSVVRVRVPLDGRVTGKRDDGAPADPEL